MDLGQLEDSTKVALTSERATPALGSRHGQTPGEVMCPWPAYIRKQRAVLWDVVIALLIHAAWEKAMTAEFPQQW